MSKPSAKTQKTTPKPGHKPTPKTGNNDPEVGKEKNPEDGNPKSPEVGKEKKPEDGNPSSPEDGNEPPEDGNSGREDEVGFVNFGDLGMLDLEDEYVDLEVVEGRARKPKHRGPRKADNFPLNGFLHDRLVRSLLPLAPENDPVDFSVVPEGYAFSCDGLMGPFNLVGNAKMARAKPEDRPRLKTNLAIEARSWMKEIQEAADDEATYRASQEQMVMECIATVISSIMLTLTCANVAWRHFVPVAKYLRGTARKDVQLEALWELLFCKEWVFRYSKGFAVSTTHPPEKVQPLYCERLRVKLDRSIADQLPVFKKEYLTFLCRVAMPHGKADVEKESPFVTLFAHKGAAEYFLSHAPGFYAQSLRLENRQILTHACGASCAVGEVCPFRKLGADGSHPLCHPFLATGCCTRAGCVYSHEEVVVAPAIAVTLPKLLHFAKECSVEGMTLENLFPKMEVSILRHHEDLKVKKPIVSMAMRQLLGALRMNVEEYAKFAYGQATARAPGEKRQNRDSAQARRAANAVASPGQNRGQGRGGFGGSPFSRGSPAQKRSFDEL